MNSMRDIDLSFPASINIFLKTLSRLNVPGPILESHKIKNCFTYCTQQHYNLLSYSQPIIFSSGGEKEFVKLWFHTWRLQYKLTERRIYGFQSIEFLVQGIALWSF